MSSRLGSVSTRTASSKGARSSSAASASTTSAVSKGTLTAMCSLHALTDALLGLGRRSRHRRTVPALGDPALKDVSQPAVSRESSQPSSRTRATTSTKSTSSSSPKHRSSLPHLSHRSAIRLADILGIASGTLSGSRRRRPTAWVSPGAAKASPSKPSPRSRR